MSEVDDYIEHILEEHDVDLNEESVIFAYHDCIISISVADDDEYDEDADNEGKLVVEIIRADRVIGLPMNFMEVSGAGEYLE